MTQFKIKVYLSESQVAEPIGGHFFMVTRTNWCFVTAGSVRYTQGVAGEDHCVHPLAHYSDCQPADGEAWSLSETDSCVDERFVEMPEGYRVYHRAIRQLPVYSFEYKPERFSPEEVAFHFPLARRWFGAFISGSEYVYSGGYLIRRGLTNLEQLLESEVEENELIHV
ncbi:hypothetical protein [Larkinella terrae]|uniref:Uncharacterized protein n=1 Tax=Larkinella terrae TaxID=2025311 RepID=A0A7K0EJQ7_9BACT|nr:hypothetical protein [Larkinella terrae]MRS61668.1 hypothetical protein [Larkinella terrae]